MITLSHVVRKRSTMRLPTSGGGTRPASAGVNSNPFLLLGRQEKGGLYFGSRRLETAIGAADAGRPAVVAELDRGEAGRGLLVEGDAEARLGGGAQVALVPPPHSAPGTPPAPRAAGHNARARSRPRGTTAGTVRAPWRARSPALA